MIANDFPTRTVKTEDLDYGMIIVTSRWTAQVTSIYGPDCDAFLTIGYTVLESVTPYHPVGHRSDICVANASHVVMVDPANYLLQRLAATKMEGKRLWNAIAYDYAQANGDNGGQVNWDDPTSVAAWEALRDRRDAANKVDIRQARVIEDAFGAVIAGRIVLDRNGHRVHVTDTTGGDWGGKAVGSLKNGSYIEGSAETIVAVLPLA